MCLVCLFQSQAVDSWGDPESADKLPAPSLGWDNWYDEVDAMSFIANVGANAWTPLGRRKGYAVDVMSAGTLYIPYVCVTTTYYHQDLH